MRLKWQFEKFEKLIHKTFNWKVPTSLPIREIPNKENEYTWEDWKEDKKNEQPIKYFLMEEIPFYLSCKINKVENVFYWIRCHTYNRYHFLDLRQPKEGYYQYRWGYCDIVQKMIYANFNMLCEFIELEHGGLEKAEKWLAELQEHEDAPEHQVNCLSKTIEIYKWWKNDLPKMNLEFDALLHETYGAGRRPYNKVKCDRISEMEIEINKLINDKLKELIDLRESMWT